MPCGPAQRVGQMWRDKERVLDGDQRLPLVTTAAGGC